MNCDIAKCSIIFLFQKDIVLTTRCISIVDVSNNSVKVVMPASTSFNIVLKTSTLCVQKSQSFLILFNNTCHTSRAFLALNELNSRSILFMLVLILKRGYNYILVLVLLIYGFTLCTITILNNGNITNNTKNLIEKIHKVFIH